jgi:hypothetical protein
MDDMSQQGIAMAFYGYGMPGLASWWQNSNLENTAQEI